MRYAFLSLMLALVTFPARACPSCAGASTDNGAAYLMATGLLLLMPPALIAGLAAWLLRAGRNSKRSTEHCLTVVSLIAFSGVHGWI